MRITFGTPQCPPRVLHHRQRHSSRAAVDDHLRMQVFAHPRSESLCALVRSVWCRQGASFLLSAHPGPCIAAKKASQWGCSGWPPRSASFAHPRSESLCALVNPFGLCLVSTWCCILSTPYRKFMRGRPPDPSREEPARGSVVKQTSRRTVQYQQLSM